MMSDHYEVVLTVFLRDETPREVLDVLRWHLGLKAEMPPEIDGSPYPYRLFDPDPDSPLPGGAFASLHRQLRGTSRDGTELYAWGLFARSYWLDDELQLGLVQMFLDLLAPHVAQDGFGGYFRDVCHDVPTIFVFRNRAWNMTQARPDIDSRPPGM